MGIITLILQMGKWRLRDLTAHPRHTARRWQRQDSNADLADCWGLVSTLSHDTPLGRQWAAVSPGEPELI